jgi:hypothetical protein
MHLNFTMIFGKKNYYYFSRIISQDHCKFIHHKSHLKPFLSYLPCMVRREYFSITFNAKKCALYWIKYGKLMCKLVYNIGSWFSAEKCGSLSLSLETSGRFFQFWELGVRPDLSGQSFLSEFFNNTIL